VARSVCHDHGAAEDAVQEAFVSILGSSITPPSRHGKVAAWVLTVVLTRALAVARMEAGRATRRASEDALRVRSVLAALPEAEREAVTLSYYGGLTHTEIAEQLDVPSATVKDRIRLGLSRISDGLDPPGA
jgi:RNA polymerase sigma-70 factor (ECF subfamily)